MSKILIDTGSLVDLIFLNTLRHMKIDESGIQKEHDPLVGFSGDTTCSLGTNFLSTSSACSRSQILSSWTYLLLIMQFWRSMDPRDEGSYVDLSLVC